MTQSPGLTDVNFPDYVRKLHQSFYGLKQSPQPTPQCLYKDGSHTIVLLAYVDDIIYCRQHYQDQLHHPSPYNALWNEDLGLLHYFLGMEAKSVNNGFFLNQMKYFMEILSRFNMEDCKPVPTPAITGFSKPLKGNIEKRSIVGSFQYLTMTRPDLAYSTNQSCQFLHAPSTTHLDAAEWILRYVKGTIDCGLHISPSSDLNLYGYLYADWAGGLDDRRSISGSAIFLGPNLVAWSSKKQGTV